MRVLMVNKFHYVKGGTESYCFAIERALKRQGHEVAWFSMRDPQNLPSEYSPFFVSPRDYSGNTGPLKQLRDGAALIYSFEAKRKFDRLCAEFEPDLIHLNLVHRQLSLSILDAPAARGVPVVYTAHDYILVCPAYIMLDGRGSVCDACLEGDFSQCRKRRCVKGSSAKSALAALEARFLRAHRSYDKIDAIIAPSAFMASKLEEGGFDPGRIRVIPNFVGEDAFIARDDCARSQRFLYAGRLSAEKGVDVLIRAFASAAGELGDGWQLVIAGDGPERESLEALASGCGAGGRIAFTGKLSGEDLSAQLLDCSFTVAPSVWRENMPYSVIESLAAGKPCIASKIGGLPELIEDGRNGWLVCPGDVRSLADALVRAAAIRGEAYAEMSHACAERARAFAEEACIGSVLELYQALIGEEEVLSPHA